MACFSKTKKAEVFLTPVFAFLFLYCSAEGNTAGTDFQGNIPATNPQNPSGNTANSGTTVSTPATVGTTGGGGGSSAGKNTFTGLGDDVCAGANAQATRIKPTVLFVVDRSGSMAEPYPGSDNRWKAVYDAVMDPNAGVVVKLQSVVSFGLVLYDGDIASGVFEIVSCSIPGVGCPDAAAVVCPNLAIVNPALNNFAAIDAVYGSIGPGGTTPTATALEEAYKLINAPQQLLDQKAQGPQFVILCTDGLPNGCLDTFGLPDQQGPIDQVTTAAKVGVKTYVVGVAPDADTETYLNQLAGYGETGASAFKPETKEDLVNTLAQIVGGAVGCSVELNGKVVFGRECDGTVQLNSEKLECNGPNGWKLTSESQIDLQGSACQKFMNDPTSIVSAKFPCDTFILQ
jgi:hypothetical protein